MLMLQIVLFFIFYLKYLIHIKNAIHSCLKGIILAREGCLYQKRLLFLSFLLFSKFFRVTTILWLKRKFHFLIIVNFKNICIKYLLLETKA